MKFKKSPAKKTTTVRVFPATWSAFKVKCKIRGIKVTDALEQLLQLFLRGK
jgi:hypothetical protein